MLAGRHRMREFNHTSGFYTKMAHRAERIAERTGNPHFSFVDGWWWGTVSNGTQAAYSRTVRQLSMVFKLHRKQKVS